MNKKIVSLFSCFLAFLPIIVSAAPAAQNNFIGGIINRFLEIIVWPLFIGLAIVMFIWAAILMMTAQGDEGKLGTARKAIIWAVVGIIVVIVSFSAVRIIKRIIEAPAPQQQMPPAD